MVHLDTVVVAGLKPASFTSMIATLEKAPQGVFVVPRELECRTYTKPKIIMMLAIKKSMRGFMIFVLNPFVLNEGEIAGWCVYDRNLYFVHGTLYTIRL